MPARKRTQAHKDAEAAYAASHPLVQVNVKWKTADDIKMWSRLKKRFPEITSESGIVRLAVKELAARGNRERG